jgi:hypothetical protein
MARTCVFCGGGPTTREHVYAKWLRDALPIAGRFRTTDTEGQLLWEQETFDIEAKVVCARCNNGWMSDLEAACGPLLTDPMLYGASLTLTPAQQRAVALWAIKTAVVLEAYRKVQTFMHLPEWHARWMPRTRDRGEHADPPPGISVVMFGRQLEFSPDGTLPHFVVSRSVGIIAREPPNDSKGYVATFVVGYAGFQVFGVNVQARGLPRIFYDPWVTKRIAPLWPPAGDSIAWPPDLVMSTADVLRFADLFLSVGRPIG